MYLYEQIESKHKIISVIGMGKNAGKTVALNEIIYQTLESHNTIGLTSIGRDGERQDVVTCTEKPTIFVAEGMYVATAEALFNCAEAQLEILEITDLSTSMGKVIIAKVLRSGNVQIAGPCSNIGIKSVSESMLQYGANIVFVDGAIDRMSSASPSITDGAILSTGAVLSRDMDIVIEKTVHRVALFSLPELTEPVIRNTCLEAVNQKQTLVIDEVDGCYITRHIDVQTALNSGGKIADAIGENSCYVLIHGSLVTKTIMDIVRQNRHYKHVTFIVKDATRLFIEHRDWQYFKKAGVKIGVIDGVDILAVTLNPYAPLGYYFDPVVFRETLATLLDPIPVFDVVHGGHEK